MYCYRPVFVAIVSLCFLVPLEASQSRNHDILTKLGLKKIRSPNTHHQKRLAVESRQHSRSDDSHMFIIKLPPNPHYYGLNKQNSVPMDAKKIPVGFNSNGKPGKVYHWNLPVLKRIAEIKQKSRTNDVDLEPDDPKSWNDVFYKYKHRKHPKPTYFVPRKTKKSTFMKYSGGNGKPETLYVIRENKEAQYHRLIRYNGSVFLHDEQ